MACTPWIGERPIQGKKRDLGGTWLFVRLCLVFTFPLWRDGHLKIIIAVNHEKNTDVSSHKMDVNSMCLSLRPLERCFFVTVVLVVHAESAASSHLASIVPSSNF